MYPSIIESSRCATRYLETFRSSSGRWDLHESRDFYVYLGSKDQSKPRRDTIKITLGTHPIDRPIRSLGGSKKRSAGLMIAITIYRSRQVTHRRQFARARARTRAPNETSSFVPGFGDRHPDRRPSSRGANEIVATHTRVGHPGDENGTIVPAHLDTGRFSSGSERIGSERTASSANENSVE